MSRYAAAHANLQGAGDARPTALQIVDDEGLRGGLPGKVALVTGGNTGLGLETARALHATGATVWITSRSAAKGEAARADILASPTKGAGAVHVLELRLDSLASVRKAAARFLAEEDRLDILVLNAGVMATPRGVTEDGFETQFGTNHLGHFLLFFLLRDTLLASFSPARAARVVSLSSIGHRYGKGVIAGDYNFDTEEYEPWKAYSQAKTANIYLATEVERRYGARGLHATAVHPGGIMTGLQAYVGEDQMRQWETDPDAVRYFKSTAQGAATSVLAAVGAEWESKGGKYLADCVAVPPMREDSSPMGVDDEGHAPWVYDTEKAKQLWTDSCKMVGVEDDE